MEFLSRWFGLFLVFWSLVQVSSVIYIEHAIQETNSAVGRMDLNYTHDSTGNSFTSIVFYCSATVFKMKLYITSKVADNKNNAGLYREFLKTVLDLEKLEQGIQVNPLVKGYYEVLKRSLDFEVKFPFRPVSFKTSEFHMNTNRYLFF